MAVPALKPPPTTTILQLNDDCLEIIFKLLEDPMNFDRLHLACAHERLARIYHTCTKIYKFDLHRLGDKELIDVHELLRGVGWHITEMDGFRFCSKNEYYHTYRPSIHPREMGHLRKYIAEYCPNIRIIEYHLENVLSKEYDLWKNLPNLTSIEFSTVELDDDGLLALAECKKLEVLIIATNDHKGFTGRYLYKIVQLHQLHLHHCQAINSMYLIKAFKSLSKLTSLTLTSLKLIGFPGTVYHQMSRYCRNLEELKITCKDPLIEDAYAHIAHLPRLKYLVIRSGLVLKKLFKGLAAKMSHQLECLDYGAQHLFPAAIQQERTKTIAKIVSLKRLAWRNGSSLHSEALFELKEMTNLEKIILQSCREITDNNLLQLLRTLTKLECLEIHNCRKITDYLNLSALDVLSEREQPLKAPVEFIYDRIPSGGLYEKDPRYLEGKLLKVCKQTDYTQKL